MCLLFLIISNNPLPNGYKLILASNRDEKFCRPTNPATFWKEHPDIIGGQDMEKGREGGTWLAMKKNGKIGTLLNILTDETPSSNKLGRGFLVNDFLHCDLTGIEYCKKLQESVSMYNPFNFVALELKKENGPQLTYYSSISEQEEPMQFHITGNNEVFAFGNSHFQLPFKKVLAGKKELENIISSKTPTKDEQDNLISSLLEILQSRHQYVPDEQIWKQAPSYSEELLNALTSQFVFCPEMNYGSRTHTIILVDTNDNVQFFEWTRNEATYSENPTWSHSKYEFTLE